MSFNPNLTPPTKVNLKRMEDLNAIVNTVKVPGQNIGDIFCASEEQRLLITPKLPTVRGKTPTLELQNRHRLPVETARGR